MSATAQLQYESRVRFKYGAIAFIAALLLVAQQLLQFAGPQNSVSELTLDLITYHKRAGLAISSSVLDSLGLLLLAALLNWLFSVTRFRNPGMRQFVRWMAVGGAVTAAIFGLAFIVAFVSKAQRFSSSGNQGYPEAQALTSGGSLLVLQLLSELGLLLLAMGCVFTCLNAVRVGLLTKAVGYAGVVCGALFIFQVLGPLTPLIQGIWLAAVAVILAARWPKGDPPAWARGQAVPWPQSPAAAARAEAQRQRPARGSRRRKVSDQEVLAAVDTTNGRRTEAPSPSTSAGKRKRKRK